MLTLHASELPRIFSCPASAQRPEMVIDLTSDEARIGSAVHEALARFVRGEEIELWQVARNWCVQEEAIAPLVGVGRHIWQDYSAEITVLAVEQEFSRDVAGITLVGRPDLVGETSANEDIVGVVWDWKSGSPSRNYRHQKRGYIALAWCGHPEYCKDITVWLRTGEVEIEDVSLVDMAAWEIKLGHVLADSNRYAPSAETCQYCPKRFDCPARLALVRSSVDEFALAEQKVGQLVPADLVALKDRADLVRQVLKAYDAALREAVEQAGSLVLPDGRELFLEERFREDINPARGWMVLKQTIGIEDNQLALVALQDVLEIAKGKLLDLVAANAPRGQKGKARLALLEALEKAGAIMASPYHVLSVRQPAKSEIAAKEVADGN